MKTEARYHRASDALPEHADGYVIFEAWTSSAFSRWSKHENYGTRRFTPSRQCRFQTDPLPVLPDDRPDSLPTDVSANTGDPPTCTVPAPSCVHQTSLGILNQPAPFFFAPAAAADGSPCSFFTKTVAPAQITHFLSESNLPAGDRTAAPDLSSASVATSDASRFTGSLNFAAYDSATIAHPQCDCGAVGRTQMHLKHFGVADQERQRETLGGVKLTLVVLAASWVV